MSGMTCREAEMVERFEAGESVASIAQVMGLSHSTVKHVTSFFCTGIAPNGRYRRAMKKGSEALLNAICETRGPLWIDALLASQRQAS